VSDRAAEYRKRAEECMDEAARITDLDQKQQYLNMANGWLKLANHADRWERGLKGEE
jgi:hypothetical protein